jgi:hypothetical protein
MTTMTVWISKYALAKGVYEIEAQFVGNDTVKGTQWLSSYYRGEGREWHKTREEALTRAEEMRVKEIAALRRKIFKMEALDFSK